MNATTTRSKANTRLRLTAANAALALAQSDNRQQALTLIDGVFTKGRANIDELKAILPLLDGRTGRLMEDCIGCMRHELRGGSGDWGQILQSVAAKLRQPEAL